MDHDLDNPLLQDDLSKENKNMNIIALNFPSFLDIEP